VVNACPEIALTGSAFSQARGQHSCGSARSPHFPLGLCWVSIYLGVYHSPDCYDYIGRCEKAPSRSGQSTRNLSLPLTLGLTLDTHDRRSFPLLIGTGHSNSPATWCNPVLRSPRMSTTNRSSLPSCSFWALVLLLALIMLPESCVGMTKIFQNTEVRYYACLWPIYSDSHLTDPVSTLPSR